MVLAASRRLAGSLPGRRAENPQGCCRLGRTAGLLAAAGRCIMSELELRCGVWR